MNIALFTYFAADNYGATLQAYATIKVLEQLGHEVELVNYVIPEPKRSVLKNLILYPKHIKFNRFRKKHFRYLSKYYASYEDLVNHPPKADCYLVGSDQTWNADISKQLAKGYFLDFGLESVLRGSYSASIGKTVWEDTEWITKADVQKALDNFNFLSIREQTGVELLRKEFGKEATLVLDPVFLFKSYPELVGDVEDGNELIIYKLINSAQFYDKVKGVAAHIGITCRSIGSIRQIAGCKCSYPESVEDWIRRIATAKYVITDSFHGIVISILYHRQFVFCIGNSKRATRILSLLKLLGLEERLIQDNILDEEIVEILYTKIDWNKVEHKLDSLRSVSFNFLKHSLDK